MFREKLLKSNRMEALVWLGLAAFLFTTKGAWADAATVNSPTGTVTVNVLPNATPELTEFLQNRATLATKMAALDLSDPQAIAQFQQDNAALITRQSQLAQTIGQQQSSTPAPIPPPLQIPPNASPQMQAYLTTRDQLLRSQVAVMNQHLTDAPATQQAVMQQWQQQNATLIQQYQQQAQTISQQQPATPLPTPPPLQIPPGTSPQMQAFLTAQDQLRRDEVAFTNQHINDDLATQFAAIQQWRQQNAARFQQIQQLAAAANSN